MICIEYTMEIVTAFTEIKDETNKNTNKQLQAVIKCYEGAVQAPGLCTSRIFNRQRKVPDDAPLGRRVCSTIQAVEWQENKQRGLEGWGEKQRPWQGPEGLGRNRVEFCEQAGEGHMKRLEAQESTRLG